MTQKVSEGIVLNDMQFHHQLHTTTYNSSQYYILSIFPIISHNVIECGARSTSFSTLDTHSMGLSSGRFRPISGTHQEGNPRPTLTLVTRHTLHLCPIRDIPEAGHNNIVSCIHTSLKLFYLASIRLYFNYFLSFILVEFENI